MEKTNNLQTAKNAFITRVVENNLLRAKYAFKNLKIKRPKNKVKDLNSESDDVFRRINAEIAKQQMYGISYGNAHTSAPRIYRGLGTSIGNTISDREKKRLEIMNEIFENNRRNQRPDPSTASEFELLDKIKREYYAQQMSYPSYSSPKLHPVKPYQKGKGMTHGDF